MIAPASEVEMTTCPFLDAAREDAGVDVGKGFHERLACLLGATLGLTHRGADDGNIVLHLIKAELSVTRGRGRRPASRHWRRSRVTGAGLPGSKGGLVREGDAARE
jgi:hypothetical protein